MSAARQAVEWFMRQDAGALTEQEQEDLAAWRSKPENAAAYDRLQAVWQGFDELASDETWQARSAESRAAVDTATPTPQASRGAVDTAPPALRVSRGAVRWDFRWAAAIAAVVVLVASGPQLRVMAVADHRTSVGEMRSVSLADGSIVTLGTGSAIAVDFTSTLRTVRLLEGEAAFEVAPNAERPFIVAASGGTTRALGTVFTVKHLDDGVEVIGIEHRVEVAYQPGRVELDEGERVVYGKRHGLDEPEPAAPLADAWRHGRLVVEGRPLSEVIDELNRHYRGHIHIMGEGLDEMRVNGVFSLTDRNECLITLEHSLGLRATRIAGYFVLLTR